LHLLVHLSLFAGKLLQSDAVLALLRTHSTTIEEATVHLWETMLNDLQLLYRLRADCTPEQVCAWLHDVIQRLPMMPQLGANLASSMARQQWEDAFQAAFITGTNADMARACAAARPSGTEARPLLHRIVDEEVQEDGLLPELLSPVAQPSFEALRTAFGNAETCTAHAFLDRVLKDVELLSLVELLWPLATWEAALRKNWGRQITQEDARNQTIGELLSQAGTKGELSRIFDSFAEAWNELVDSIRQGGLASAHYRMEADCHPVEPRDLPHMDRACKVSMCCIDSKGEGNLKNLLQLFLQMLGRAQNDFLAATTQLAQSNASLQALNVGGGMIDLGKKTPLLQLAHAHVLLDHNAVEGSLESLKTSMLAFSCCGAAGRRVEYDFAGIEASVASRLLKGTTLVDFDQRHLVPFPFGGELMQQRFRWGNDQGLRLLQAVEKAIEQQPMPNMDKVRSEPFLQETHQARALLELLELVLHDVTKSRPAPSETLVAFCSTFGHGRQSGSLQRFALECDALGKIQI